MSPVVKTALLAGLLGGTAAVLLGRPHTRFDNAIIGGLFTTFAAYRDPRASVAGTLLVATVEGMTWGLTDRLVPALKDALMPVEG